MMDVKMANEFNSDEDKYLKKEVDKIKKSIDDIKKLIDKYKKNSNNSADAIGDIKTSIDKVIDMMTGDNKIVVVEYKLGDEKVTNENIIAKIKLAVEDLEKLKEELQNLKSFSGNELKQEYDRLKQRVDEIKQKIDSIKSVIDNEFSDWEKKFELKMEADGIKLSLETGLKTELDSYKGFVDNSDEAIADIEKEIDEILAMMIEKTSINNQPTTQPTDQDDKKFLEIKKGFQLLSGSIEIAKLPKEVRIIWIYDNYKWSAYSPHKEIKDEIVSTSKLITKDIIKSHIPIWIEAYEDCKIELKEEISTYKPICTMGQNLYGTQSLISVDDITCKNSKLLAIYKFIDNKLLVYKPNNTENNDFINIFPNEVYYTICIEK